MNDDDGRAEPGDGSGFDGTICLREMSRDFKRKMRKFVIR